MCYYPGVIKAAEGEPGGSENVKATAFKRLAEQRTNAVLEKIRILGNCANRSLYDYTEEDVRRIFHAIHAELRKSRDKFENGKPKQFSL